MSDEPKSYEETMTDIVEDESLKAAQRMSRSARQGVWIDVQRLLERDLERDEDWPLNPSNPDVPELLGPMFLAQSMQVYARAVGTKHEEAAMLRVIADMVNSVIGHRARKAASKADGS